MKKFELLRYLKKFSILIFLVALLGSVGIYWYANNNQKYTAYAIIRFTDENITQGLNPDGTKFDAGEIYSSPVISQAMENLGVSGPLNIIRSRCSVDGIISDEQQAINDALTKKGEPVTYVPDTYRVSLVVNGNYGASYARNVLDAILQSYCTYYTEKYVEQKLSLNPSANLASSGYDYFECVRILEDDTEAMLKYLVTKKDVYSDFRSSKTGYSFVDLYNIYNRFSGYTVPALYAKVLDGPQVRDGELLMNYLANEISSSEQTEQLKTEQLEKLKKVIDNFVLKSSNTDSSGEKELNGLLGLLDRIEYGSKVETTYDTLIHEMVAIDKAIAAERIDRQFLVEVSDIFGKVGFGSSGSEESHRELENDLTEFETQLRTYYDIVNETSKEFNLAISADYLRIVSTVRVAQAINVNLYIALALVLFFIVGCIGAVILGRSGDFLEYFLYIDKKSGLPNRDKLSIYIEHMSGKVLTEDYTCFAFHLDNLRELTAKFGYSVGDGVLKDFSLILRQLCEDDTVIGYNGVGKFVAFFDKCSGKKAAAILTVLEKQVNDYNALNTEYPIAYSAAAATTTTDGIYQLRELIRMAESRVNSAGSRAEQPGTEK